MFPSQRSQQDLVGLGGEDISCFSCRVKHEMSSQNVINLKKNRMSVMQVASTERSHDKKMGTEHCQLMSSLIYGFPFQIFLLFNFPGEYACIYTVVFLLSLARYRGTCHQFVVVIHMFSSTLLSLLCISTKKQLVSLCNQPVCFS